MNRFIHKRLKHNRLLIVASILMGIFLFVQPALAAPPYHEAPKGSEWIMADWMFLSFLVFASVAFMAFIFALKRGLLSNLEDAKYYILDIDEADYYTPEWARNQEGGES
jgi:hypothetical protein